MCKILSIETILSVCTCTHAHTHTHTHTHTQAHTHKHTDYTKLNLHNLKQAANTDLILMKTVAWNGKHGRSTVLGEKTSNYCGTPKASGTTRITSA